MIGANGQAVKPVWIGGRLVEVDAEIAAFVAALNSSGFGTAASCSGHGHRPGCIALADGREIIIARDFEEARMIGALFPLNINGEVAAQVGRNGNRQDREAGLGPKDEHAAGEADAPKSHSKTSHRGAGK